MYASRDFDLVVAGGAVFDSHTNGFIPVDVGVCDGKIVALEESIDPGRSVRRFDATGFIVAPGLIDSHVHSYAGVNVYGFDVDPVCMRSGVTTVIDAGSSGPVNFVGFRDYIAKVSRTRQLAFVALAKHGVINGELVDLRFADPDAAAATVRDNRDVAVGIKVRVDRSSAGCNGREALELALAAGSASSTPVMVHVGDTEQPMQELVAMLRPGDIVTHCFTPLAPTILGDDDEILPEVKAARNRGVLFDVGHANRHFDVRIIQTCLEQRFPPDLISTDLHVNNVSSGRIIDLPNVLSKFLALEMKIEDVLACVTSSPARAIGMETKLGEIAIGREADLTILRLDNRKVEFLDSNGVGFSGSRRLEAVARIRSGAFFS